MGLCPLHGDHKPSFLVDANKNLFYCYGCGRGGDLIRFTELYHQVKFSQATILLISKILFAREDSCGQRTELSECSVSRS